MARSKLKETRVVLPKGTLQPESQGVIDTVGRVQLIETTFKLREEAARKVGEALEDKGQKKADQQ